LRCIILFLYADLRNQIAANGNAQHDEQNEDGEIERETVELSRNESPCENEWEKRVLIHCDVMLAEMLNNE
jgi:hypothetical protein